jgi:ubiquinone/menaquinone biosynthesis C-methylase UbiE
LFEKNNDQMGSKIARIKFLSLKMLQGTHMTNAQQALVDRCHPEATNTIRAYRHKLTSAGQASPLHLGKHVTEFLQKLFIEQLNLRDNLSILDVGCGLGLQMALIKSALPALFNRVEGIDWSPATVEKHNSDLSSIFDKVTLCSSDKLPYEDGEFDIALSMENLEHLYGQTAIDSIKEMARIAKYLIITTPLPQECVNHKWLYQEIVEAILDPIPLNRREFICLESAVHKSTLFPESMKKAGFMVYKGGTGQGYYLARSSEIDITKIKCIGIEANKLLEKEGLENENYKDSYLKLLAESVQLHSKIVSSAN